MKTIRKLILIATAMTTILLRPSEAHAASISLTNTDLIGTTSFNSKGNWNSSSAPSAGNSYSTSGFDLRTPPNNSNYTFTADSLTVGVGSRIIWKGSGITTINNLVLAGGGIVNGNNGSIQHAGTISIIADSYAHFSSPGAITTISASITNGTGSLIVTNGNNTAAGNGALTLSGNNVGWTGRLIISQGVQNNMPTLNIDSETRLGGNPTTFTPNQLTLTNTILSCTAGFIIDDSNRGITIGGTNATIATGANSVAVAVPITGPAGLTKTGTGVLKLSATNSYSGGTAVKAGVLTINGLLAGGSCLVATNAVLAGNGTVSGNVTVNGSLQPGDSCIGTDALTVSNLVMSTGAIFGFHFSGTPNLAGAFTDQLTVTGDLVLNRNTVAMTLLGTNLPAPGTYRLINYTGAKIGSLGSVIHSTRYTLTLDESITNQINLVVSDSGTPLVPYYFNPFEGAVGTEWSQTNTDITPANNRRFLGQFGAQTVSLNFAKFPAHTAGLVSLDLYLINTWDGNNTTYGPDRWSMQVSNGPVLIDTTFANSYSDQAYPSWYGIGNFAVGTGAIETNSLGYPPHGFGDTVYHLEFAFADATTNISLNSKYTGVNYGGITDESWGLDNVKMYLDSQSGESWPLIMMQPQSQTVSPGTNITFNVSAIGNPGVTYQWALNGVNISDATNTWLSITNVQRANSGIYTVKATNPFGSVTSADAILAVIEALPSGIVSWWPANGNALDIMGGRNGYLSSGVSYAAGKVGQTFAFDGTTNAYAWTSGNALTNIQNTFTIEFWAFPTESRSSTTESITGISGTGNQRYAIMPTHGGDSGPAGAGVSVGTNGVSVFEHAGGYLPSVLVYNTTLVNWTHVAVVYQNKQAKLYLNGVLVRTGLTSTRSSVFPSKDFSCSSTNYGIYKGFLDEVTIYNRALAQPEIVAIYAAGSAGKSQPPNNLVLQPQNQTASPGQDVTFSVSASGEPPLQYQWLKNGEPIPLATGSALQLSVVSSNDMARYTVIITNAYGTATSAPAALAVSGPLEVAWIQQLGGTNYDAAGTITTDAAGSLFIAGGFSGNIELGGTNLTSDFLRDLYIAKYSNAGILLWAMKDGGSTNGAVYTVAAHVGDNGDILLTGYFTGAAVFSGTNLYTQGSGNDVFVAKYDRKGNLGWVAQAGGTNSDLGEAIATDAAGNVFVTGWFQGTAQFGSTNLLSHGGDDSFLSKYGPSGNLCWVKDIGGTNTDRSTGLAVNSAGEVTVCGVFSGTADFGGTVLTAQERDVFLAKYDSLGNLIWARNFGGTYFDEPHGLALDPSGNIFVTGMFYSAVADFGGISLTNGGASDLFVCKYNAAGQLIWARQAGGTSYDNPGAITTDNDGNCYIVGSFMGVADFGNNLLVSGGGFDVAVAKWDAVGEFVWAKSWGGPDDQAGYGSYGNTSSSISIALDSANNVFAVTKFNSTAIIGDTNLVSRGSYDLAIAKIGNAPVQPLITLPDEGPTIIPDGLRFRLDSVPAQGTVIMEASSDLGTWLPIATNTAAGIPLDLVLPADGQEHRFYRARVEP